jgi:hypothetical protein
MSPPDITPPGAVTGLNAAPGNTHIVLTWTNPPDSDFDRVEITIEPAVGTMPISVAGGLETCDVKGLENGTPYTFTVVSVDTAGNRGKPATETAVPDASGPNPAPDSLTSIAAITAYLAEAEGGDDADNPVILSVTINLISDGEALLSAIQAANKSVALDLSACAMTGMTDTPGEFGLQPGTGAGSMADENLIVSLVLPRAATSIVAYAGFGSFKALKSVSAEKVAGIGQEAFAGCIALTAVSFPAAATIDTGAFSDCIALTTVSFPAATAIGEWVFQDCAALTTVSFPVAATIGESAFSRCDALTGLNLPAATAINTGAFENCTALTTANLPEATTIGMYAFNGCAALTEVSLPKAVTIGERAFFDCASLTTLNLPAAATIGESAFSRCDALTGLNLPAATTIGDYAFSGAALTEVSLPAATVIGDYAFTVCAALTEVSLPAATAIGDYAFDGCAALTTLNLPAATSIGEYAFYVCAALTELNLQAVTDINENAFAGTGETTLVITLPKTAPGVTNSSSPYATDYSKLVILKAPENRTGYDAAWETDFKTMFAANLVITLVFTTDGSYDITNPQDVIGLDSTFGDGQVVLTWTDPPDDDLDHLAIAVSPPENIEQPIMVPRGVETHTVTGLVNGTTYTFTVTALDGAGNRSDGISLDAAPGYSDPDTGTLNDIAAHLANAAGGADADHPVPLVAALNLAANWEALLLTIQAAGKYVDLDLSACAVDIAFNLDTAANTGEQYIVSLILPGMAESIFGHIFSYSSALKSVSGAKVLTISPEAFRGCVALTTVSLPKATDIASGAFRDCASLKEASFPVAETIGYSAFWGCSALTTAYLPEAIDIGGGNNSEGGAFEGCASLTMVSFPKAESIGDRAFAECAVLAEASLPAAVTIGNNAFEGCSVLTEMILPAATDIGYHAFSNALISVSLPSATDIGYQAFYGYADLKTVSLPAATSIGEYAFYDCAALTELSLPAAAAIGIWAFSDCAVLAKVNLPAAASIGDNAFYECSALTEVSLPSVTTIGERAFRSAGATTLAITLPKAAPRITSSSFLPDTGQSKTITIKTPAGKTGYDAAWETAFKTTFHTSGAITLNFEDL